MKALPRPDAAQSPSPSSSPATSFDGHEQISIADNWQALIDLVARMLARKWATEGTVSGAKESQNDTPVS